MSREYAEHIASAFKWMTIDTTTYDHVHCSETNFSQLRFNKVTQRNRDLTHFFV